MKLSMMLGAVVIGVMMALPSAAQGIGRVERSQAEIAYEQADADFQKMKSARDAAQEQCTSRDYKACYELAELQRKGLGGVQDLAAAVANYKKVCEARDGRGCAGLAYLTVQGRGVAANPAEARKLYKQACDMGEVSGCAAWGNMAYTGAGGPKDTHNGNKALIDSCDKGYEWACQRMRDLGTFDPKDRPIQRMREMREFN